MCPPTTVDLVRRLEQNEVHVWQVALSQPPTFVLSLRDILVAEEIQRADRFVFPIHRQRFTVARGALRTILGLYLGQKPSDISFAYNRYGKPSIGRTADAAPIRFNLSHSAEHALCAITWNRDVGIDIEAMREIVDSDRMAARYFDPLENASYQKLPSGDKMEGFFARWTMKEAYIKARGEGLSIPLDQFTISTAPDSTGFHRVTSVDPHDDERWTIARLSPPTGYVAAIAVEGHSWDLQYLQWQRDREA